MTDKILACVTGSRATFFGMPGAKRGGILAGLGKD
jgi:hypothetical protein